MEKGLTKWEKIDITGWIVGIIAMAEDLENICMDMECAVSD